MNVLNAFFQENINHESKEFESKFKKLPTTLGVISGTLFVEYNCLQCWFLRSSFGMKLAFMKRLFQIIREYDLMVHYTRMVYDTMPLKLLSYIKIMPAHTYKGGIIIDDNRALPDTTLKIDAKRHIEWFKQLTDDLQVEIFSNLLNMGSYPLIVNMAQYMADSFNQQSRQKPKAAAAVTHSTDAQSHQRSTFSSRIPWDIPDGMDETLFDSTMVIHNPYADELVQKRKAFDDMIAKYKMEVEGVGKKHEIASKSDGSKSSRSKSSTESKKKKRRKSSKSKKKKRSVNTGKTKRLDKDMLQVEMIEDGENDYIELLPIWIVKKILSYLNNDSLKTLEKLDPYWQYVVQSFQKDLKVRAETNQFIEKLKEQVKLVKIPPGKLQFRTCPNQSDIRMEKMLTRGSILPPMRKELKKFAPNPNTYALMLKATKQEAEHYALTVNNLNCYKRMTKKVKDSAPLYKRDSYILNETGLKRRLTDDKLPLCGEIEIYYPITINYSAKSIEAIEEEATTMPLAEHDERTAEEPEVFAGVSEFFNVDGYTHNTEEDTSKTNIFKRIESDITFAQKRNVMETLEKRGTIDAILSEIFK